MERVMRNLCEMSIDDIVSEMTDMRTCDLRRSELREEYERRSAEKKPVNGAKSLLGANSIF